MPGCAKMKVWAWWLRFFYCPLVGQAQGTVPTVNYGDDTHLLAFWGGSRLFAGRGGRCFFRGCRFRGRFFGGLAFWCFDSVVFAAIAAASIVNIEATPFEDHPHWIDDTADAAVAYWTNRQRIVTHPLPLFKFMFTFITSILIIRHSYLHLSSKSFCNRLF